MEMRLRLPVGIDSFEKLRKLRSQRDRYTGYFTVPLAYKLIYYCNWINILRSNYKLNNSAFLLFHNPI